MIEFIDQHLGLILYGFILLITLDLLYDNSPPPDLSCWNDYDKGDK